MIISRVAALLEGLGEDKYLSTTSPADIASIVYVARNLHTLVRMFLRCVGALLAWPPVHPALKPLTTLPTRTIPFTPSQIPTVPPFLNNTKLQKALWRIVNNPWFPPSRPSQPPPRQQDGRRLYTNKRADLSDRRAAILDVMVPLGDLDDPLREEVRDLLHGVVRSAALPLIVNPD